MAVSQNTYQHAVKLFRSGILMKDIVKEVGVSDTSIYKWAKKNNITLRNEHGRKNTVNKSYFDIIDTEEKAYWLGFIYADGCVQKVSKQDKRPNRMRINLTNSDASHLEKLNKSIDSTYPITTFKPNKHTYSDNEMCYIAINSVEFVFHLTKHGVHERKTHSCEFPFTSMPQSLYRHFIRGVFDGDGTVHTAGTAFAKFRIIGNLNFINSIQSILMSELQLTKTKLIEEKGDMFSLDYGGRNNLKKIFNYLYEDATIYLDRKYNKFYSLLSQ